jgi:hypothetical protein
MSRSASLPASSSPLPRLPTPALRRLADDVDIALWRLILAVPASPEKKLGLFTRANSLVVSFRAAIATAALAGGK